MRQKPALTLLALIDFAAGFLVATALSAAQNDSSMHHTSMMPKPAAMSIYNLGSEWQVQSNARTKLIILRGRPVLAAMIYTHCADVCPLILEKMQEIAQSVPATQRHQLQLVLFSMDWTRDTPAQLRAFATGRHLDLKEWTLFRANENAVRELAAAFGFSFYSDANGDYQHSIAIFLLDRNGAVAAELNDMDAPASEMIAALRKLILRNPRPSPPRK